MVLPEIEEYIGHKIPVASYDPALLPELKKPAPRPRKERRGGPRGKDGGSDRRPRRRPRSN
jgi:ATP-dependent RNA helicase RhlB